MNTFYIPLRDILQVQIKKFIKIVIDYLWEDEHKHFQEKHYHTDHISRVLKELK